MLQRLKIALAQVTHAKWNQTNYIFLFWSKEITKKVYNNIMKSIKLWNRMDTIILNCENSKTSDPHRLLLNLWNKINFKRSVKYIALSNLRIYYIWKNIKKPYKNNKFKIPGPTWNEEFELPDES